MIFGPGFEIDSWNYIDCVLSFDYPPVYPYFLYLLRQIYSNAYFTCSIQILIMALAISVFACFVFKNRQLILIFSILAGLDPASSYYSSSFMSEALFIPLLLIYLVILHQAFQNSKLRLIIFILLGSCIGLLYSIRYTGLLLFIPPLLLFLLYKQVNRTSLKYLISICIGFQLIILPVRYTYKVNFDTYQFNGFTGRILWNNASSIYPTSQVRNSPKNKFESYLLRFPDRYFSTDLSIRGRQLWEDTLPLRKYAHQENLEFKKMPEYNQMVLQTSLRIMLDQPLLYLRKYVIPGFFLMLKESTSNYPKGYENKIYKVYQFQIHPKNSYHRELLLFYLLVLVLISLMIVLKRDTRFFIVLSTVFCLVYLFVLPFIGIQDSRLYMILSLPVLSICVLRMRKEPANLLGD